MLLLRNRDYTVHCVSRGWIECVRFLSLVLRLAGLVEYLFEGGFGSSGPYCVHTGLQPIIPRAMGGRYSVQTLIIGASGIYKAEERSKTKC